MQKWEVPFKPFKSRTFLFWFLSYITILIVPLILFVCVYFQFVHTTKEEALEVRQNMLWQFSQLFDQSLRDIEKFPIHMSKDSAMQMIFSNNSTVPQESIVYSRYLLQKKLKEYCLLNSMLENIFWYDDTTKTFLSKDNYWHYDELIDDWSDGKESLISTLESGSSIGHASYFVQIKQNKYSKENVWLTYYYPIPRKTGKDALLLRINLSSLRAKISNAFEDKRSGMFIVNENSQILALTNHLVPENVTVGLLSNDAMTVYTDNNNRKYQYLTMRSKYYKWNYVHLFECSELESGWGRWTIFLLAGMVMVFPLCMVLSYYFTKRHYSPIKRIANMLNADTGQLSTSVNELNLIEEQIQVLQGSKASIEEKLSMQEKQFKDTILMKLLEGRIAGYEMVRVIMENGFAFLSDYYMVAILSYYKSDGEDAVVMSVASDLTGWLDRNTEVKGYLTQRDAESICVILTCSENNTECRSHILEAFKAIPEIVLPLNRRNLRIVGSSLHNDIQELHLAYKEALEILEYCEIAGINECFVQFNDKAQIDSHILQEMVHVENSFLNCMRAMELEKARNIYMKIQETAYSAEAIATPLYKFKLMSMRNTLLAGIGEFITHYGENILHQTELMNRLLGISSLADLIILAKEVFDEMQKICLEKGDIESDQLLESILSFISKNYQDINLSVTTIAEAVELHPNYLTQFLKQKTGKSTLDHIHFFRLQKAKELLGGYSVKEVANMVGYQDVRSLIRIFKKYEGITPSQFKNLYLSS